MMLKLPPMLKSLSNWIKAFLPPHVIFLPLVLLLLGGCFHDGDSDTTQDLDSDTTETENGDIDTIGYDTDIVPPDLFSNSDEIATALSSSESSQKGVWSLLKALGIGVYTVAGKPVMYGSETSEDDFWLYDFQVTLLEKMQSEPAHPFAEYHSLLAALGYTGSQADLLAAYRETYLGNATAFLPSLFSSMGLNFEDADFEITPFQEWLLILDGFVAPNPSLPESKLHNKALSKIDGRASPCDNIITKTRSHPLWGLVSTAHGLSKNFGRPVDPKDLVNAAVIHVGVETSLKKTGSVAHEGHDGKTGAPITFTASARYVFDIPKEIIQCGAMRGDFSLPEFGPIANMRVDWNVPNGLSPEHGTVEIPDGATSPKITYTDANGETWVRFRPREELANGEGPLNIKLQTVTASYNIQQAMGNQFSLGGLLQEIFNHRSDKTNVSMEWHEQDKYAATWEAYTLGSLTDSGSVHTCNFPEGPWHGETILVGATSQGGANILFDMDGTFTFNFPAEPSAGVYAANTSYTVSGTETISADGHDVVCNISYERTVSATLYADTHSIRLTFPTATGTATCMGVPQPIAELDRQEILKPLEPYTQCQ